jgi:hypothetical protein
MGKTQGKFNVGKAPHLVRKMLTLVSIKGEDISLQSSRSVSPVSAQCPSEAVEVESCS